MRKNLRRLGEKHGVIRGNEMAGLEHRIILSERSHAQGQFLHRALWLTNFEH